MNDQYRILSIFLRLQSGAHLSKRQLADEFEVSDKTIQRDFSLLSDFIENQPMVGANLVYDRKTHIRHLEGRSLFNKKDILVISKIILESRALNAEENQGLLDSLLQLVSKEERQEIKGIIASEWVNYEPIFDQQDRIDKLWRLAQAIREEQVLDITYFSPYSKQEKSYAIFPVSIYFDNHYFYLMAYHMKHEDYITLKLDRIEDLQPSPLKKPSISYGEKPRDGDTRNEKVDAFVGQAITVELDFYGDETIVLDQFPRAKIIESKDSTTRLTFTSQDTSGLLRWLLSQGATLKVLAPQSLVKKVKAEIDHMKNYY